MKAQKSGGGCWLLFNHVFAYLPISEMLFSHHHAKPYQVLCFLHLHNTFGQARETTGTTPSFGHRSNLAWEITKGAEAMRVKQSKGSFQVFRGGLEALLWLSWVMIYVIIYIYDYIVSGRHMGCSFPFLRCVSALHRQLHRLNLDLQWAKIIQFLWVPPCNNLGPPASHTARSPPQDGQDEPQHTVPIPGNSENATKQGSYAKELLDHSSHNTILT